MWPPGRDYSPFKKMNTNVFHESMRHHVTILQPTAISRGRPLGMIGRQVPRRAALGWLTLVLCLAGPVQMAYSQSKWKQTAAVPAGGQSWACEAQDWPQFLGPHANGHADERLTSTDWTHRPPQRLWSVELHDNGYAAPASAKGKVFIMDHEEDNDVVRALDLKSGQEAWRFAYSCKIRNWYGYAFATPAYDTGKLYTLSRVGQLHCLDACRGSKDDSQHLVCLDAATGQEKWRQPKYGNRWYDSGGLLLGDKILVTNGRTGDLFLVAATGQRYHQLASLLSPAGPETLPAPILSQGILLLRSRNQLVAFGLVSLPLPPAP